MRLSLPTEKEFTFIAEADSDGLMVIRRRTQTDVISPDSSFTVKFRQAARFEDEQRSQYLSQRKFGYDGQVGYVQIEDTNDATLARLEAELTLSNTDLEVFISEDTVSKPEFAVQEGVSRVSNRNKFATWWGRLPNQWAEELHKCVLEVNPKWGPKRTV